MRDWCQARGVALRVLSGPLSNFHSLAARSASSCGRSSSPATRWWIAH
ncbi:hypothetical protein [Nonomuraea sp. NPDC050540]